MRVRIRNTAKYRTVPNVLSKIKYCNLNQYHIYILHELFQSREILIAAILCTGHVYDSGTAVFARKHRECKQKHTCRRSRSSGFEQESAEIPVASYPMYLL
jgi:hypothetical protein